MRFSDALLDDTIHVWKERRDQQVSALADLGSNIVQLLRPAFVTEREGPGVDMLLVAVDQCPVDVE